MDSFLTLADGRYRTGDLYALPRTVPALPLTANGKLDGRALAEMLG